MNPFILTLLFVGTFHFGTAGNIQKAIKYLNKRDYPKAKQFLDKAIEKKKINPQAYFIYSLYFSAEQSPQYQLDSAFSCISTCIEQYHNIHDQSPKEAQKELLEIDLDLDSIKNFKNKIEHLIFRKIKLKPTPLTLNNFIEYHQNAHDLSEAIKLRDSLVFAIARTENSIDAYQVFMKKYPKAQQYAEATKRKDTLEYLPYAQKNTLDAFQYFHKHFLHNHLISNAEEQIMTILLTEQSIANFEDLFSKYPKIKNNKRFINRLFYLYLFNKNTTGFFQTYPDLKKDYQKLAAYTFETLYPIVSQGKKGWIDATGKTVIKSYFIADKEKTLTNYSERWLTFSDHNKLGISNKSGEIIFPPQLDEAQNLSFGYIKYKKDNKWGILTEWGEIISDAVYDDIEFVNEHFIKIKKKEKWGLINCFGRRITDILYDDIELLNTNDLIFEKDDRFALLSNRQLFKKAGDTQEIPIQCLYEEISSIDDQYYKLKIEAEPDIFLLGVLGNNHAKVLPLQYTEILKHRNFWLAKKDSIWQIFDKSGHLLTDTIFDQIIFNEHFIGIKENEKWHLLPPTFKQVKYIDKNLDSLFFIGQLAFIQKNKKTYALFPNYKKIEVSTYHDFKILKEPNHPSHYFLEFKNQWNKSGIFNSEGDLLLPPMYENIYMLNNNFFSAQLSNKYGLLDSSGRKILPFIYDGIGNWDNNILPFLKNKKFGALISKETLIQAEYDAAPKIYNTSILITRKKEHVGLSDHQNNTLLPHQFDKILYWNDSTALVQNKHQWIVHPIKNKIDSTQLIYLDNISTYLSSDSEHGKHIYFIGSQNHRIGVWYNQMPEFIAPEFTQIKNFGTTEAPFFIAEKKINLSINDQELINVHYFNGMGERVKKRIMNEEDVLILFGH